MTRRWAPALGCAAVLVIAGCGGPGPTGLAGDADALRPAPTASPAPTVSGGGPTAPAGAPAVPDPPGGTAQGGTGGTGTPAPGTGPGRPGTEPRRPDAGPERPGVARPGPERPGSRERSTAGPRSSGADGLRRPGGAVDPNRRAPARPGGAPPGGSIPEQLGGDTTFRQYRALVGEQCAPAPPGCVRVLISDDSPAGSGREDWIACDARPGARTPLRAVPGRTVRVVVGRTSCDPPDGESAESTSEETGETEETGGDESTTGPATDG